MFNGIVECIGQITDIKEMNGCKEITIKPDLNWLDLTIGCSVSVNGVCLTVTQFTEKYFKVTIVPETLCKSNLNELTLQSSVNLEQSLTLQTRIGGHLLQGHIDCVGRIVAMSEDSSPYLTISIPQNFSAYVIDKGFIAIDGMSITVIKANNDHLTVTLIPHTRLVTIAKHYHVGSLVNLEFEPTGKYIEKLLGVYAHERDR